MSAAESERFLVPWWANGSEDYVVEDAPPEGFRPLVGRVHVRSHEVRVAPDGHPFPPQELIWMVGRMGPDEYWRQGEVGIRWITAMLERHGIAPESVLDFGCGCARVTRHWKAVSVSGCDYNPYLIQWAQQHLPQGYGVNAAEPPLSYEDQSFDLVYALSVFTHLEERLQVPWLRELKRVTKPGGNILITVHGESRLDPRAEADYRAGRLAVVQPDRSGTNACGAWHPPAYLNELSEQTGLRLVEHAPDEAKDIFQDAVLFAV